MIEICFGRPHGQFPAKFADDDQRQSGLGDAVKVFGKNAGFSSSGDDAEIVEEEILEEELEPRSGQRHVVFRGMVQQEAVDGEMLRVPPRRRQELGIMKEA